MHLCHRLAQSVQLPPEVQQGQAHQHFQKHQEDPVGEYDCMTVCVCEGGGGGGGGGGSRIKNTLQCVYVMGRVTEMPVLRVAVLTGVPGTPGGPWSPLSPCPPCVFVRCVGESVRVVGRFKKSFYHTMNIRCVCVCMDVMSQHVFYLYPVKRDPATESCVIQ